MSAIFLIQIGLISALEKLLISYWSIKLALQILVHYIAHFQNIDDTHT
jgi:hypothetical protein